MTKSHGGEFDVAIVGAGAAGLTAAIFAKQAAPAARVVAFDGAPRIGAKILISGGGRCNVTHDVVTADDFNGASRNTVAKVLRTFPVEETVAWFRAMGVELKREETGKLFPVTDKARTVIDALLRACQAEVLTGYRVEQIERMEPAGVAPHPAFGHLLPDERGEGSSASSRPEGRFLIPLPAWRGEGGRRPGEGRHAPYSPFLLTTSRGTFRAKRVILATGGRSVPKTGSDGHGYLLARGLGHTTTELFPALVPLVLGDFWTRELSGTSVVAELQVRSGNGRVLRREAGSLLFTHFGLSGPVVLDVSRHWLAARRSDDGVTLAANLLPGETFESLEKAFLEEGARNPRATPFSLLRGRLPERLLERLAPSTPFAQLSKDERRRIVRALVETTFPVVRDRGFDYAEVTAGGVPLSEVDVSTMASRVCPGLYLCGEIVDVDGKIGGYNFQWAWTSGRLAGINAATLSISPDIEF